MSLRNYIYGSNSTDPSTLEPTAYEQEEERESFKVNTGDEYTISGSIHRFGIDEPTVKDRYEYYKQICVENGIPSDDVKTLEDFTKDYNSNHFTLARRLFVLGGALRPQRIASDTKLTNDNPFYHNRNLADNQPGRVNIDRIMAGIERAERVTEAIKTGVEVVTGIKNDPNVARIVELAAQVGLNSNDIKVSKPSSPGNLSGFDWRSSPVEVSFKTNISNHAYTEDYETPEKFRPSLHATSVDLQIPDNSRAEEFFDRLVTFLLQNKFQSNVNFNVDLTKISATQLRQGYDDVLTALAMYYYHESILAFTQNPSNKNDAMLDLRNGFDAEIVYALRDLKRVLDGTPIPPSMITMVKYLFQNFRANSLGSSAILKLVPFAFTGPDSHSAGLIKNQTIALTHDNNRKMFSLICRAMPSWRDSQVTDSPSTALHDAGFTTMFSNLPFAVWEGTTWIQGPTHDFDYEERIYGSLSDDLDGAYLALSSSYDTTINDHVPGFITPRYTTNIGNRLSYGKINDIYGWYNPFSNMSVALSRNEVNIVCQQLDAVGYTSVIPALFESVSGVSIRSVNESAIMLLEHIFETDTIQAKRTLNRSGSKSRKPRRKSGKSNRTSGSSVDDNESYSSPRDEL